MLNEDALSRIRMARALCIWTLLTFGPYLYTKEARRTMLGSGIVLQERKEGIFCTTYVIPLCSLNEQRNIIATESLS